jgi:hypothetical protein
VQFEREIVATANIEYVKMLFTVNPQLLLEQTLNFSGSQEEYRLWIEPLFRFQELLRCSL